jgi:hypothetical protein
MAGRMINGAAALAELIRPARDTGEFGTQRALPVLPALSNLLPQRGLRRGSTVAIGVTPGPAVHQGALPLSPLPSASPRELGAAERGARRDAARFAPGPETTAIGSGSTSLLLALLAAASAAGSWCAVVGVPTLGALAAAESGIALDRLALVPNPGPEWPTVVAALIDGVDVVVIAVPGQVSASIASRLVARARQRGCVLVPYGRWTGADVTLQVTQGRWEGLGTGHGRLRRREVTVIARGRGTAAWPKEITMWMPGLAAAPRDPGPGTAEPPRDRTSGSPESSRDAGPGGRELSLLRPVPVPPSASAGGSPSAVAGPFVAPSPSGGGSASAVAGPLVAVPSPSPSPSEGGPASAVAGPFVAVSPSPSGAAEGASASEGGPGSAVAGPLVAVPPPSASEGGPGSAVAGPLVAVSPAASGAAEAGLLASVTPIMSAASASSGAAPADPASSKRPPASAPPDRRPGGRAARAGCA